MGMLKLRSRLSLARKDSTPSPRPVSGTRFEALSDEVQALLENQADAVPFHGWTHTDFVRKKAVQFASARSADVGLVEAAALVHDLNYVVAPNSAPSAGCEMRREILRRCTFSPDTIERIEQIIDNAHTEHRRPEVDVETACLSDADTLYKALPITPVLFAHRYLAENGIDLGELAEKIVVEQIQKLKDNYYFYDERLMTRYRGWAEANLGLWEAILDAMNDPEVAALARDEVATERVARRLPPAPADRGSSRRRYRTPALQHVPR